MLLGNKMYSEPPGTMANMRERIIAEYNKVTPDTLHDASELLICRFRDANGRDIEPFL